MKFPPTLQIFVAQIFTSSILLKWRASSLIWQSMEMVTSRNNGQCAVRAILKLYRRTGSDFERQWNCTRIVLLNVELDLYENVRVNLDCIYRIALNLHVELDEMYTFNYIEPESYKTNALLAYLSKHFHSRVAFEIRETKLRHRIWLGFVSTYWTWSHP